VTALYLPVEKTDHHGQVTYLSFDLPSNILLIVFIDNNTESKSSVPH